MSADNGGPAFPVLPPVGPDGTSAVGYPYVTPDISIRDYFAAKALAALIAKSDKGSANCGRKAVPKLARFAYEYADAMLLERAK